MTMPQEPEQDETKFDLYAQAVAVETGDIHEFKSVSTGEVRSSIETWHVITTYYEDETVVLASGTEAWPMDEEQAEDIALALRVYADEHTGANNDE